jgi:hypothetical protein
VVQSRVIDAIFGALADADPVTRYYLAAQYSYGYAAVPFDEANNLARMTSADLDLSGSYHRRVGPVSGGSQLGGGVARATQGLTNSDISVLCQGSAH